MSVISAEPEKLIHYARVEEQIADDIRREASNLTTRLQQFESRCLEPERMRVSHVARTLRDYGDNCAPTSGWVRQVARRFQEADAVWGTASLFDPMISPALLSMWVRMKASVPSLSRQLIPAPAWIQESLVAATLNRPVDSRGREADELNDGSGQERKATLWEWVQGIHQPVDFMAQKIVAGTLVAKGLSGFGKVSDAADLVVESNDVSTLSSNWRRAMEDYGVDSPEALEARRQYSEAEVSQLFSLGKKLDFVKLLAIQAGLWDKLVDDYEAMKYDGDGLSGMNFFNPPKVR